MSAYNTEALCRVCLVSNARMQCIERAELLEIYNKLSPTKMDTDDGQPKIVCYICYSQLKRCRRFYNLSLKAEKFLQERAQNIKNGIAVITPILHTTYNLALAPTNNISIESSKEVLENKKKTGSTKERNIKIEKELEISIKDENEDRFIDVGSIDDDFENSNVLPLNVCDIQYDNVVKSINEQPLTDSTDGLDNLSLSGTEQYEVSKETSRNYQVPTKIQKQRLVCNVCGRSFKRKSNWEQHIKTHERGNKYDCSHCDQSFGAKATMLRHILLIHKIDRQYFCAKCSINFTDSGKWQEHKQSHIKENKYSCKICSKTFAVKKYLAAHIKSIHNGESRYACETCNRKFEGKFGYLSHMKLHGEKKNNCDRCGQVFSTKGHLNRHIKTHTGEKPYACNLCDKKFSAKSSLIVHNRSHTGEKPYSCDRCGKMYTQKGHLSKHIMNIHTGEKPYACDLCSKRYVAKINLIMHKKSHTGEKPFICEVCSKAYAEKFQLNLHMKNHTGEKPYACDKCSKSFPMRCYLVRHMKWTHGGIKPHSCDVCGKAFTHKGALNAHMRSHTGEKPFACVTCNKTYSSKSNLLLHMKTHVGENT